MKELERKDKVQDAKPKEEKVSEQNGLSFEERKEINRAITRTEKEIEKNELEIASLEEQIAKMDELLSSPEGINDSMVYEKYEQLKSDLELQIS